MTFIVEMPAIVARHLEDILSGQLLLDMDDCALCQHSLEWLRHETTTHYVNPNTQGQSPLYAQDPSPMDDPAAPWQSPVALLTEGPQS